MATKILKYVFAIFLILVLIVLLRAYLHQPDAYQAKISEPIIFDEAKSINNLSRSIQFETISHPDYEKFDYDEFQRFLAWLEEAYFQVFKNLEKQYLGETLLLKWKGEDSSLHPILLTGHYDVVPVREDANSIWQEKPFSGKIDDEYVWGRGALDDKSGVIAILEAVDYLLTQDFVPNRTIYLSFGHDEEPSSNSSVGYLAEALLKLEDNPIPGKLEGISLGLFDEVSKQMPFQYKILFANLWLFEPVINSFLSNSPTMNAVIRTTTAPTMLSASNRINVLASEAKGTVNFRLHPRDNPETVVNFVNNLIGNENIEVKKLSAGTLASSVSDWDTDGYRAISNSVREVYGDIIVAPGLMVGGSDSKHYGKAAKNSYRFNPFPLSASELSGLHGIDERIKKEDFLNGIRSYIRIIQSGSI